MYFGGIEAGGTKFAYGIADEKGNLLEKFTCPTSTPDTTFTEIINYFKEKNIKNLGIGSFGPVDLDPKSPTYGYITSTPKPHWGNTDFANYFQKELGVPVAFDTDVNVAALGEITWGAAKGLDSCLYLTIGTGIGGGAIVNNTIVHGFTHPEMGHIQLPQHPDDDYAGFCPYHKNCFEGLAAGPALADRWQKKGHELPLDHQAWQIEAYYIAQALLNYIYILAPKKIILGGGVMKQAQLFPLIHTEVQRLSKGYIKHPLLEDNIADYIVPPLLGDNAGIMGAIALGMKHKA